MSRWMRNSSVLWRRSGSSVVILSEGQADPFLLTGAGALVWDLLAEPIAAPELSELIARLCGSEPGVIARDTDPLLTELERLGAVEAVA